MTTLADLEVSCSFPPSRQAVELARTAESLGYRRAWFYDSPALYPDVWATLARVAEGTEAIGLGPAVLVPSLRHVVTNAAAIVTVEDLAPGRLAVAVGTGFTGRMVLGQCPLSWATTRRYIERLRGLLRGEEVELDDGRATALIHPDGYSPTLPVDTPILVAANGPKGNEVARDLGDGVMTIGGAGNADFAWCASFLFGTVLEQGEDPGSDRAVAAAGPGLTALLHGMYEMGSADGLAGLPGGAEWVAETDALPEASRHLTVHADHMAAVADRDRALVSGDLLAAMTWTGPPSNVRDRAQAFVAAGGTEVVYAPHGPDPERELEAFITAVRG